MSIWGTPPAGSSQVGSMGARPTFSVIYRERFSDVVRALRMYGVPERYCEDVAQDVFASVHASLPRYDASRPFRPWFNQIIYRTARDFVRSAAQRREQLSMAEEPLEPTDGAPSPERVAQLRQQQRILGELLQELSEDHREVFLMHVVDEIEIPDVATATGVPENTVRSRLHRARTAFDDALARRRAAEERRASAAVVVPMLAPMGLVQAGRAPVEVDPAMIVRVWGRLTRVLGTGIVGTLAPLSMAKIVAGAALVFALGGGTGAAVMRAVSARPAVETVVLPAPESAPALAASAGSVVPSGSASAAAPAPTATVRVTSDGGTDAGAPRVDSLRAEQAFLDRAWSAYQSGSYETALRDLGRHERAYPNGVLAGRRRELKQQILNEMAARDAGGG